MNRFLITGVRIVDGPPTDLLIRDGVVAAEGRDARGPGGVATGCRHDAVPDQQVRRRAVDDPNAGDQVCAHLAPPSRW